MSLFERSEKLFGKDGIEKLRNSSVIVFGAGGVGSVCLEFLARSGVGRIGVVDGDFVSDSNRNRQIIALSSTVGQRKAYVEAERIKDINPDCRVDIYDMFYGKDNFLDVPLDEYMYIADCIDTVTSKILLITQAKEKNINIISSMGTGNRLDPSEVTVKDVYETSNCPLAKVMRRELRARGIESLKTVCSDEKPCEVLLGRDENGRSVQSSACFVPAAAGIRIAYEIVKEIISCQK